MHNREVKAHLNSKRSKSHMPPDSIFYEKLVPILLLFMGVIMTGLILFAGGVLLGLVKF